ncbi:DEAD/DEAH box helicase [Rubritalea profundi]|uniref:RNA helicase n=1 Tax=Rubritalea profundi TaxID=1658618 RepID=A0A2S7U0U1_9BACT|nr:DEAD/DEAH box helicase [Rubritalea profundi]PQJ28615.1 RNA helicase [Rubritalea profundi]
MSFSSTGLSDIFLSALESQGHDTPTPIQQAAIPAILDRKDVMGIAKTGSGKTASFVLPILQNLLKQSSAKHREPAALILVPTRELADQVLGVIRDFSAELPQRISSLAIYGGSSINTQMQSLGKIDILVATPGRLIDLIDKNAIKLSSISTLVLDEADKMLNLGFKEEVDKILSLLPATRQNLLFSATLSPDLTAIQQVLLSDPVIVKIEPDPEEVEDIINELGYFVKEERKGPLLRYLIRQKKRQQILVFASSAKSVDSIVNKLRKNKIDAAPIHSQLSQGARREVLRQFKEASFRVLVATDLIARGIDIEALPCVINYELPRSPKDYIHRIGRTGRAGSPGDAITLITMDELPHFRVIQKKTGKTVPMQHSDGINLHGC